MSELDKSKRKTWSKEETLGFLYCYQARKEEFTHSRRKKHAYANVLEDMIAQGLTSSTTTTFTLEGKMRTLLVAYKAAKDNAKKTGASPCIAPYMDEMEEIFGDRPINSNIHTVHLGRDPTSIVDTADVNPPDTSSRGNTSMQSLTLVSSASPNVRKRKSSLTIFAERKLELKKEDLEIKQLMREAKQLQKEEFMKQTLNALEKKWERDHEIEKQKVELLRKLIEK